MARQAVSVLLVALAACRGLLDANEFAAVNSSEPEFGYLSETCSACVETECADEIATCRNNADCNTQLECVETCTSPDCNIDCWLPYERHPTPLGIVVPCLSSQCATECLIGENYECAGNYSFPKRFGPGLTPMEEMTIDVAFALVQPSGLDTPLEGIRVRSSSSGEGVTGADGRVQFTVPAGQSGDPSALLAEDTRTPPRILPSFVQRDDPRQSGFEYPHWPLLDQEMIQLALSIADGSPFNPERAYMLLRMTDCQDAPARGIRVSLTGAVESTFVSYVESSGVPSPALEKTSVSGQVAIGHIPPGLISLTGTEVATGRVVYRYSYVAEPGQFASLSLLPIRLSAQ